MQETDAVSCLLCLQADEYGSMIKVCVPPGRIPPSTEKVVCRRCLNALNGAVDDALDEVINGRADVDSDHALGSDSVLAASADDDPNWDRGLPERADESLVETDQPEPGNPPGSSKGKSKVRVASGKTDD